MNIKVSLKLYPDKIKSLEKACTTSLEQTGNAVLTDIKTSQVVPKDTSTLEDSGFVDASKISLGYLNITFDTPYARRLYWHPEYNFRKDKNVNARGLWMQNYEQGGEKENYIKNVFTMFLKKNSGGLIK